MKGERGKKLEIADVGEGDVLELLMVADVGGGGYLEMLMSAL